MEGPWKTRAAAVMGACLVATLGARHARAEAGLPERTAQQFENSGSVSPARPKFEIAIGMGVSVDSPGLSDGRTVMVPSFQVQGGVGGGSLGFEGRLFSSTADGRYHLANNAAEMAINRLAVDLMLAWRPLTRARAADEGWLGRMVRSLTVDVGLGAENAISSQSAVMRTGVVLGAHLDVPLTPLTDAGELRVRLVGRRLLANQVRVGSTAVSDSKGEVFGALAFVF